MRQTIDLTALLESLPDFDRAPLTEMSRQKRWELSLTDEQLAARRKRKNALRRKQYRADKQFQERERLRLRKWYAERGKQLRHGS